MKSPARTRAYDDLPGRMHHEPLDPTGKGSLIMSELKDHLKHQAKTMLGDSYTLLRSLRSIPNADQLRVLGSAEKTIRAVEKLVREVEELIV